MDDVPAPMDENPYAGVSDAEMAVWQDDFENNLYDPDDGVIGFDAYTGRVHMFLPETPGISEEDKVFYQNNLDKFLRERREREENQDAAAVLPAGAVLVDNNANEENQAQAIAAHPLPIDAVDNNARENQENQEPRAVADLPPPAQPAQDVDDIDDAPVEFVEIGGDDGAFDIVPPLDAIRVPSPAPIDANPFAGVTDREREVWQHDYEANLYDPDDGVIGFDAYNGRVHMMLPEAPGISEEERVLYQNNLDRFLRERRERDENQRQEAEAAAALPPPVDAVLVDNNVQAEEGEDQRENQAPQLAQNIVDEVPVAPLPAPIDAAPDAPRPGTPELSDQEKEFWKRVYEANLYGGDDPGVVGFDAYSGRVHLPLPDTPGLTEEERILYKDNLDMFVREREEPAPQAAAAALPEDYDYFNNFVDDEEDWDRIPWWERHAEDHTESGVIGYVGDRINLLLPEAEGLDEETREVAKQFLDKYLEERDRV